MCAASLIKKDVALPPGKLSSDENTLKFIVKWKHWSFLNIFERNVFVETFFYMVLHVYDFSVISFDVLS